MWCEEKVTGQVGKWVKEALSFIKLKARTLSLKSWKLEICCHIVSLISTKLACYPSSWRSLLRSNSLMDRVGWSLYSTNACSRWNVAIAGELLFQKCSIYSIHYSLGVLVSRNCPFELIFMNTCACQPLKILPIAQPSFAITIYKDIMHLRCYYILFL